MYARALWNIVMKMKEIALLANIIMLVKLIKYRPDLNTVFSEEPQKPS